MGEEIYHFSSEPLDFEALSSLLWKHTKIGLSDESAEKVKKCRSFLDDKISKSSQLIYGVNTGFGALCNTVISNDQLLTLQENLVTSHACGIGEEVPQEVVRLMLLLKIKGLVGGNSGISLSTLQRLIDFFNNGIHPVIYQQGSMGASGDLAPLAHLSLPLIGKGEVNVNGKRLKGNELEQKFSWEPITLKSKEGLALLNGTQFMSAYGARMILRLEQLRPLATLIAAMSIDAYYCRMEPFDERIQNVRPHQGQKEVSAQIRELLKDSGIAQTTKLQVQDPYSFRCIPQVHGASYDAIATVKKVMETEMNSVTDNPTVFPDDDVVLSAGNFHGQPLALHLDFLAIAVAELASISERRTYKLISGSRGLPPFLTPDPGLNSGFMIPQYAAASIVSQNKQLCTPASVDTIDSSNGQEDHVSMGANAATKAFRVVDNYEKVLAIELINAAQAMEFRRPNRSSDRVEALLAEFREVVPFADHDKELYQLIQKSQEFIRRKSSTNN